MGAVGWIRKDCSDEELLQRMELIRDYIQRNRAEQLEGERQAVAHLRQEHSGESRKVLVVDDEVHNLELLCTILGGEEAGGEWSSEWSQLAALTDGAVRTPQQPEISFEVVTALQGEEAVAAVEQAERAASPFAVALIDMRMPPGIDGLETARQIRQRSPAIEIVLITAYSDYSLQQIQQVLGRNFSFMGKPYNPDSVLQRVVEGCEKWSSGAQIKESHRALLNLAGDMEQEIVRRKQVERQLEQASRTKDEFLSSMSHELRTPLTTMIGYSEVLSEEHEIPLRYREMAESSLLAGKTLLQLVNDILDMSKIRAGKFALNVQPFDLRKVVTDVTDLMRVFDSQKGVVVERVITPELESDLGHCWMGDEMRISQILFNLLSNALKFSEPNGVVTLRLSPPPSTGGRVAPGVRRFQLEVVDHGVGMSEAVQARLFQPFEQADSSTARRFGGTGLGLFICKQLSNMMGGEIEVTSREGEGSTFTLVLPLQQSDIVVEKPVEGAPRRLEVPALQGSVLLAEDTVQLQRLTTMLVEKSGAKVMLASNGLEALELGLQHHFDLVLMDVQMPEMDGIEATRLLRVRGVETPIIALTGNVMPQHREIFESAGGNGLIPKPIQRDQLYQILAHYLQPAEEQMAAPAEPEVVESVEAAESVESAEEDLSDLLSVEDMQVFWDYVDESHAILLQARQQCDREQLRKTAHAIKGMGAPYGKPGMSRAADQLQNLALTGDETVLDEAVERLLSTMTRG
jgi:two-component system sensor histidine kinase/response regulator